MELLSIEHNSPNKKTCEFQCRRDAECLPRRSQICDGRTDCTDRSDEENCPSASAIQSSSSKSHILLSHPSLHADFMQEVSGAQVCIVAVVLVLTLGLITCVINHYNKMGARSWNGDQRKTDNPRKPSSAAATLALYSPTKARERARKDMLLYQEHQLRMLSVQTDIALNLPYSVHRPSVEESQKLPLNKSSEVPRAYLIPPPNKTVAPNRFTKCPPQEIHRHSSRSLKNSTDYSLVNQPAYTHKPKKRSPSLLVRISNSLERWHSPRIRNKDVCTITIFDNAIGDFETDDLPPKYEDIIQGSVLPAQMKKTQSH